MLKLTVADSFLHRDILLGYFGHSCTILEGYNHVIQKRKNSTYMPGFQCPCSLILWNWDPSISTMVASDYLIEQLIFAFGVASGSWYQCSILILLERTNPHMVQVTKSIAYLCALELLVTYQSVCTLHIDFSLVDETIAATSFELTMKVYMQMCWPLDHGV
jgi:hypothetical protein